MTGLVFAEKKQELYPHGSWKILIVDDVSGIHSITKTVLRNLIFDNKKLEFFSAYNRDEAKRILLANNDIALILLDVVMDEDDSGLKLVKFIREEMENPTVRIILRTGYPGRAPAQQVIIDYDINDYEVKTELTALKLYTTVLASLRNYNDLKSFERIRIKQIHHRTGLSRISEASSVLFRAATLEELVSGVHREMFQLLGGNENVPLSSFSALQDKTEYRVTEVNGTFKEYAGCNPDSLLRKSELSSLRILKKRNKNLLIQDNSVYLYEDARSFRFLIYLTDIYGLELQDRQLLDIFASNVSIAFENLRLNREITGNQDELINKLSEVVETRSHDTAQHVRRVGLFCELIAGKLGISEIAIHDLKLASTMHDIGKIGIPDDILLKPGSLSDEEFSIVKTHTVVGYSLLKSSSRSLMKIASGICLEHHEKFDGSGYPNGLSGDSIELNSRIVSICDVFDSITHGRLHREPWNTRKAADYLKSEKGKAFDPLIVDVFLDNLAAVVQINLDYPD